MNGMSKVITAEYDATEQVLRLAEPLEGVDDHTNLIVTVEASPEVREPASRSLSGALSKESAEEMARLIEEMFPIEK